MANRRERFRKAGTIVIGVMLIFCGAVAILQGRFVYGNYWGGAVFPPVAIIVGGLMIYAVLFRWKSFNKPRLDKRGRRVRFPADDFRKW